MHSVVRLPCLIALGLLAGACATIANGTTQAINIDSEPAGAECTLMRGGQQLSNVTTPAPVTVKRDQQTIQVRCKKDGYEETLVVMNSRYETASAGNILLGGVIGMMIDNSSGANAKYDPRVMVRMAALSAADQAAAAARSQVAASAAPVPPGAAAPASRDGNYRGEVLLGATAATLREIDVTVSGDHGQGTVTQKSCLEPGKIEFTIDSSEAIAGDMDARQTGSCGPYKMKVEGRLENGIVKINVTVGERTIPISLAATAAGATGSAPRVFSGPWKAHNVLIAEKSVVGNCISSSAYSLDLAGDTLTVDNSYGRMLTIAVPPDGLIDEPFRSPSGNRLAVVGNARTRDLDIVNSRLGCRWKLVAD